MESARAILQVINPETSIAFSESPSRKVSRKRLINRLNFVNFQDGSILVNFRHNRYDRTISLDARPLPCNGDLLECRWAETAEPFPQLASYSFDSLYVIDEQKLLVIQPEVLSLSAAGASFRLGDSCTEISYRKVRRHLCTGVEVSFIQFGALFRGTLLDFCTVSCRVEVTAKPPQTFQWLNPELPVSVIFSVGGEAVYSGECRIIKQGVGQRTRTFILHPITQQIRRFKPKEYRSTRQEIRPLPNIYFRHPLTDSYVDLEVVDLAATGFAVEEDEYNSVLLPGIIIPELELNFAGGCCIRCKVQVIYRQALAGDRAGLVKCGLTILDMDPAEHVKLLSITYQARNRHSYICNRVDMDALWEFFFETGFIYPHKYAFLRENKNHFRDVYKRLYTQAPSIARHFIYQDKGAILGHMAMVRFYENSWLIHHHAANNKESNRAGVEVLNQIGRFINDSHRLYSLRMNYVFCYFRPENKFPNRVFGGVAKHIAEPQGCSLDTFAFFHIQASDTLAEPDGGWQVVAAEEADLSELESFYHQDSGGLLLDACDLGPDFSSDNSMEQSYESHGFHRKRRVYAVRREGRLAALVLANEADVGLNMSDLTNSLKVFILDADAISGIVLSSILSRLARQFEQQEVPVLLYPVEYAEQQAIPFEKRYTLWILNMQYNDQYLSFCESLLHCT